MAIQGVIEMVRRIKDAVRSVVAGNIATEAARARRAGADAVKAGIGPSGIATRRRRRRRPQISASTTSPASSPSTACR
jgi:IMP dehydrogenase/GMP reductase